MSGSLGKSQRALVLLVVLVLSSIVVGISIRIPTVMAALGCGDLGGSVVGGECQISASQLSKAGTYIIAYTLRIMSGVSIDATGPGSGGISLSITGDFIMETNSKIEANDDTGTSGDSARPITIVVSGNMEMEGGSAIYAENTNDGGKGGDITIQVGGDLTLRGGAIVSSSKFGGGTGNGGKITISVDGSIDLEPNSIIAANSGIGKGGEITMTVGGTVRIDGLVSSGPSTTVNPLPGRLTGYVLDGGGTNQEGGKITIVCNSLSSPALTVSKEGIIVSQGQDPGADTVMIEGCDVEINGLVASVGKKLKAEVILRSGDHITINGQDLGQTDINSYPNQGRVRADNTADGADQSKVDIFARGSIDIHGPPSGTIFVVTSNPGSANSRPPGGFITVISLEDGITATGKAFQAGRSTAGNSGGTVDLKARLDVGLDGAIMAVGDFVATGGYGTGGEINVRSFSAAVSWVNGVGDVQPTGTGIPAAQRGVITLTACTTVDTTGTSFPVTSGSATTPTISTGVCSPSAPTLPVGVADLPYCSIITIIKDTVPDKEQDFSFTTTGGLSPSSFTLDDDPLDPMWPNNQTYMRVASGSYTVTETLPVADFDLTNLVCIDPDGGTTVDLGTGTATIDVDASETITCTFTNEPSAVLTGSITIIKDTKPDDPQDFAYTTSGTGLSDFSLDDDGDNTNDLSNSTTFTGLGAGDYSVKETLPVAGFSLTGLSCEVTGVDTSATPNPATGEVSITLGAGGTVKCTFTNEKSCKWCTKSAVLSQVEQNVGKCCATPDIIVDLRLTSDTVDPAKVGTTEPATGSLQAAVDYIIANGDLNGDGALFIGVTAQNCGTGTVGSGDCMGQSGRGPYGHGVENVVITNTRSERLNVFGCSVDLTAEDPDKPVITIKDSIGKVTVLDIHVMGSNVAGYLIEGNGDLVVVKNGRAMNNGVGYWIKDDKVEITGSPEISGNGVGLQIVGNNVILRTNNVVSNKGVGIDIQGDNNVVRDEDVEGNGGGGVAVKGNYNEIKGNDVFLNGGDGISVVGDSNMIITNDVGEKSKGNNGDGIHVVGKGNTLDGNGVFGNLGDGIEVLGAGNLIKRSAVGERDKGNVVDGIHVEGAGNTLQENGAYANRGDGFDVSGGTSASPNVLQKNRAGDRGKGNLGNGFVIVGTGDGKNGKIEIEQNTAKSNVLNGIKVTGSGHQLKNNVSGGGLADDNGDCEFVVSTGNFNATGNKANNVTIPGSNGSAFPAACIGTP